MNDANRLTTQLQQGEGGDDPMDDFNYPGSKHHYQEAHEGGEGVHDIFNMPEPNAVEPTGNPKEDALRQIVAQSQAAKVDGVMVDLTTASAIVQILDAIRPEVKEKYLASPVQLMAKLAMSQVKETYQGAKTKGTKQAWGKRTPSEDKIAKEKNRKADKAQTKEGEEEYEAGKIKEAVARVFKNNPQYIKIVKESKNPARFAASLIKKLRENITEGEFIGHHAIIDGEFFVDSNFLNKLKNIPEMGSLEHIGMGDFSFNSQDGKEMRFSRGGKDMPGQVGRSHSVYAHPPEFIEDVVAALEAAGHSTSAEDAQTTMGESGEAYNQLGAKHKPGDAVKVVASALAIDGEKFGIVQAIDKKSVTIKLNDDQEGKYVPEDKIVKVKSEYVEDDDSGADAVTMKNEKRQVKENNYINKGDTKVMRLKEKQSFIDRIVDGIDIKLKERGYNDEEPGNMFDSYDDESSEYGEYEDEESEASIDAMMRDLGITGGPSGGRKDRDAEAQAELDAGGEFDAPIPDEEEDELPAKRYQESGPDMGPVPSGGRGATVDLVQYNPPGVVSNEQTVTADKGLEMVSSGQWHVAGTETESVEADNDGQVILYVDGQPSRLPDEWTQEGNVIYTNEYSGGIAADRQWDDEMSEGRYEKRDNLIYEKLSKWAIK